MMESQTNRRPITNREKLEAILLAVQNNQEKIKDLPSQDVAAYRSQGHLGPDVAFTMERRTDVFDDQRDSALVEIKTNKKSPLDKAQTLATIVTHFGFVTEGKNPAVKASTGIALYTPHWDAQSGRLTQSNERSPLHPDLKIKQVNLYHGREENPQTLVRDLYKIIDNSLEKAATVAPVFEEDEKADEPSLFQKLQAKLFPAAKNQDAGREL